MSSPLEASAMRTSLAVATGDPQSEILVLDARGRLLDRGMGPQREFPLEPGIYRIKVLTGTEAQEKSAVLPEGARVEVRFEPMTFASAAPLDGTSTSHEYHQAAADRESRITHVRDGAGSSLFFFVRDWTPSSAETAPRRSSGHPADGLSLHAVSAAGERKLCDLTTGSSDTSADPWAACTVEVAPGVYELRLELPGGETLRQSFVASAGRQTQSFFFMRPYPSDDGPRWRADLARTAVFLSRSAGFDPHERLLRMSELARVALATKEQPPDSPPSGRPLLPDELRELIRWKAEDPILGIIGAHLLLLEASPDLEPFAQVVRNLRNEVGHAHPDVEALALRAPGEPAPLPFEQPPMLSASWRLVVNASVARPELVPEALANRNTGNFLGEGPWHVRRFPAPEAAAAEEDSLELSPVESAVAEALGVMRVVRRMARTPSRPAARALPPLTLTVPRTAAPVESAGPQAREGAMPMDALHGDALAVSRDLEVELDPGSLRSVATRFGISSTKLQSVLTDVGDKLTRNPRTPNLKFRLK